MDGTVTRFGEIDAETLTEAKMEGRGENKVGTVRPVICSIERKFDHGRPDLSGEAIRQLKHGMFRSDFACADSVGRMRQR